MTNFVEWLLETSKELFLPLGFYGLASVAFMEAVFFPVPPDALLIPLVLADPRNGLTYGLLTTLSSVLGGIAGYYVGLKAGRPIAERIVGKRVLSSAEGYFNKYGALAVGVAAFTPLPFKAFTITAGVLKFSDLRKFVIAAAIGRASRFVPESVLLMLYGELIIDLLVEFFEYVSLLAALLIIIVALIIMRMRRTRVKD